MTCFGRSRHRSPRIEVEVSTLLRSQYLLTIQIDYLLQVLESSWVIRSQSLVLEDRRYLQFVGAVR
jgi:hypothetical protein